MVIRHALKEDVKKIMEIYEYARRFMASMGIQINGALPIGRRKN